MRKLSVLAASGLAAVATFGMTGAANATGASEITNGTATDIRPMAACIGWESDQGAACFDADGDHFYVEDLVKEGYGIQAYWETDYGRNGLCRDYNGTGDGVQDCNENLDEDGYVRLALQLTNDGEILDSTGFTDWIAIRQ